MPVYSRGDFELPAFTLQGVYGQKRKQAVVKDSGGFEGATHPEDVTIAL
jgi:hypothetical protein